MKIKSLLLVVAALVILHRDASAVTKTIKPDGTGDYTTFAAWATATSGLSGQQDAEFYSGGDLGALTITFGWTPSSTRIYPGPSQQHWLSTAKGAFTTGAISISRSTVTLEGIRTTSTVTVTNCNATVKNSIIGGLTSVVPAGAGPITPTFVNCVMGGGFSTTASVGATISPSIFNCFVNGSLAWNPNGGTINITVKNTMASTFSAGGAGGTFTMSNNLSADATADDWGGTGHLINKSLASQVQNTASNWTLKPAADVINTGTTVAAANPDAQGDARPESGAYDIGPDEYLRPRNYKVGIGIGIGI